MQIEDNMGSSNGDNGRGNEEHEEVHHNDADQQNGHTLTGGELAIDTAALLHRTMEALYEMNPNLEDSNEGRAKMELNKTKIQFRNPEAGFPIRSCNFSFHIQNYMELVERVHGQSGRAHKGSQREINGNFGTAKGREGKAQEKLS